MVVFLAPHMFSISLHFGTSVPTAHLLNKFDIYAWLLNVDIITYYRITFVIGLYNTIATVNLLGDKRYVLCS